VLEELKNSGFDSYILSNGTLIDPDTARRLAGLGVKGVQISIEGPEHIHDNLRGPGSFSSSIRGIRDLLDAGLELTIKIPPLSEINAPYFMDVIDLASSIGVQRVGFSRLVPSGGAKKMIGRNAEERGAGRPVQ